MTTLADGPARGAPGAASSSGPLAARGLLALGLGLVGQLSSLGLLVTSAWLITTSSLRPPIMTLTVAIAAVRAFALLRGLGRYGERLAGHDLALRLLARTRVWSYRQLERVVPGGLGAIAGGDVVSRVVADVEATQDLVVRVGLPVATGLASAAVAVAICALVLPVSGVALGAGLLTAGVVVPTAGRRLGRSAGAALGAARARVAATVVETLEGAADLLAFGAIGEAMRNLADAEEALGRQLRRRALAVGSTNGLGALVAGATTLGVVGSAAAALAERHGRAGGVSAVAVAVVGFVSLAAFDAIASLPEAFARLEGSLGAARRVRALGTLPSTVAEPTAPAPAPVDHTIALCGVSVGYGPEGPAVLEGIDLVLVPGRRVALVGASGAGKTTLALTLLRFVELRAGTMTLGGTDVAELASDDVRARIAWAPQDPAVFATTLAANLRLARPDAGDDELRDVIASVGLGSWLERLPGGLDSELGERGQRVSGGERQRIGLARALLARRPVLLLDEPTAHLDADNEALVRGAVTEQSSGRALVWITHRLVGLEDFDEVVVVSQGRIVERGHATELMRRRGAYGELAASARPAEH